MRAVALRRFQVPVVEHMCLGDGAGDVGVCEGVDDVGAGEETEVVELSGG